MLDKTEFQGADLSDIRDFTDTLPPVPEYDVTGWKEVEVKDCGEKLVPLGFLSDFPWCDTSAIYFGERGLGEEVNFLGQPVDREVSLITPFVREGILEKLKDAQFKFLPGGYYFKFLDCYRPLEVQQKLFDTQKASLAKQYPELNDEQLTEQTQTYVSIPAPSEITGTKHPSPHSTGGVVDLTIVKMSQEGSESIEKLNHAIRDNGVITKEDANEITGDPDFYDNIMQFVQEATIDPNLKKSERLQSLFADPQRFLYKAVWADIFRKQTTELDMGTAFDSFEKSASPNFFEKLQNEGTLTPEQEAVLANRRLLHYVMQRAGFTGYGEEWWHFSCGDNMNAKVAKKPFAKYGGAQLSEEMAIFDKIRKSYYTRNLNNPISDQRIERANRGRGFTK